MIISKSYYHALSNKPTEISFLIFVRNNMLDISHSHCTKLGVSTEYGEKSQDVQENNLFCCNCQFFHAPPVMFLKTQVDLEQHCCGSHPDFLHHILQTSAETPTMKVRKTNG